MMTDKNLKTVSVDKLEPHPFNRQLYSEHGIGDLADRIDENGFKDTQRLTVTTDYTILSGHRRWQAARELGIDSLPVEVVDIESEEEQKRRILLANEYRDKTPAEKIREAEAWEELEKEKAKERNKQSAGASPQKLADTQTGEAKEKAAKKVGTSKETLRRGQKIKEKAENGDETAQQEWEKMETGEQSIHGAYTEINTNKTKSDSKPKKEPGRDNHTELHLVRILSDGSVIYSDGGDTYLVPKDELPTNG